MRAQVHSCAPKQLGKVLPTGIRNLEAFTELTPKSQRSLYNRIVIHMHWKLVAAKTFRKSVLSVV